MNLVFVFATATTFANITARIAISPTIYKRTRSSALLIVIIRFNRYESFAPSVVSSYVISYTSPSSLKGSSILTRMFLRFQPL